MSLLERIYFFHDELIRKRFPNARTLMREFEISLPTARRDIAYLRDRLLAPVEFSQKKNGFYYSEEGFSLPFENSPRIIFLLGMLNKLAEETGLSDLPEIRQLEKRLSGMISEDLTHITDRIHCEWIEVEHPDSDIFDTIIESIVKKRQLTITYKSLKNEETVRTVEPLKLINYQGRWYLSGLCTMRHEARIFHVARILQGTIGGKSEIKMDTVSEHLDHSFGIFKGKPIYHAEILFTGEAAELVKSQYWHKNQVVRITQKGVLFRLPVRDHREIMMKIMQYGAKAKVIKPAELAEKIKKEASELYALYQS